jgi:hemerythrin superfamily protein
MARRATTKKTARKTAAKKGAAKRSTAKKTTAKKAASKRASGKTAARRSTTKTARRATAKTARKSAAKTARKSAGKSARGRSARKTARREPLAIQLLKQDHREVEAMGKAFERASGESEKAEIAQRICQALTVHAQIEEEIFYPRARDQNVDDDMLDEAYVEHQSAKDLIAQIQGMGPGERYFEAKVKVLIEYVQHHVQEEENELFPAVQKKGLDLDAIGEELQARKAELQGGQ